MDDRDKTRRNYSEPIGSSHDSSPANATTASGGSAPYRRATSHISQAPINDVETEYVMPNRYTTVDQARPGRRHMGVATSDPNYLKPANGGRINRGNLHDTDRSAKPRNGSLHYDRYLQTPKSGKSIFVSQQRRQRQRVQRFILIAAILLIVLLFIWLVFLR